MWDVSRWGGGGGAAGEEVAAGLACFPHRGLRFRALAEQFLQEGARVWIHKPAAAETHEKPETLNPVLPRPMS